MAVAAGEPEVAVERSVSADPVMALGDAERDGLLAYLGFVAPDGFEVELFGRVLVVARAAALELVARLRTVDELGRSGLQVRLVDVADGVHVLKVSGREVRVPDDQVVDWADGFRTAWNAGQAPVHAGEDRSAELVKFFAEPSMPDQMRMVLLGLMFGRPDAELSASELAVQVGAAKKTVGNALRFGMFMPPPLAEQMIRVFGLRWSLADAGGVARLDGKPVGVVPEMPALVRLRRIAEAADAGWVKYLDDPAVNSARWLRSYAVALGTRTFVVEDVRLLGWLAGVAAFRQSVAAAGTS